MPTYEYECLKCGWKFERRQSIHEGPVRECPRCHGRVQRLVSGGGGFIMKDSGHDRTGESRSDCALNRTGKTCCGRDERCGKPPCGEGE
ncbi:MAG: zinc ribbon domain-containing protein [Candidatus Aminicenantes bacterium]|nr:zinc ribbon domain-containing protein [Candidatus Aminicenantes bacterium]